MTGQRASLLDANDFCAGGQKQIIIIIIIIIIIVTPGQLICEGGRAGCASRYLAGSICFFSIRRKNRRSPAAAVTSQSDGSHCRHSSLSGEEHMDRVMHKRAIKQKPTFQESLSVSQKTRISAWG